eukprot:CCRYP_016469-RA/>CCRYP_016469-RA protein AED:0.25 eAED:0.25 QI:0/0/0/1/1/1/2/0/163
MRDSSPSFALHLVVLPPAVVALLQGLPWGCTSIWKTGRWESVLEGHSSPPVHAVGVCYSPDYFYNTIAALVTDMGLAINSAAMEEFVCNSVTVHQGKGRGYAVSSDEELISLCNFLRDPDCFGSCVFTEGPVPLFDEGRRRGSAILLKFQYIVSAYWWSLGNL